MDKLQQVHQHRKTENSHKSHAVNNRLYLSWNGLAENPLYEAKNYFAAVQRGNGQKIENRQIDPDICRNLEETLRALRGYLRSKFNGGDRTAYRGQT